MWGKKRGEVWLEKSDQKKKEKKGKKKGEHDESQERWNEQEGRW